MLFSCQPLFCSRSASSNTAALAEPAGTIGNTLSSLSIWQSMTTGHFMAIAFFQRRAKLFFLRYAHTHSSHGLRHLYEIRLVAENRLRIPLAVKQSLPLAHHAQHMIIEHDLNYRNFILTSVAISFIFIRKQPSPATLITVLSGLPHFAPMAAPRPYPMVPSPPEVISEPGTVYL